MVSSPVHDPIGQQCEPRRIGQAASGERGLGHVAQVAGMAARGTQAEHRDVGRLVVVEILAGRLAQGFGRLGDVENVVHDLERQAERIAVVGERRPLRRAHAAAGGAHQHARLEQRARLAVMHVAQRVFIERQADARQIDGLAAGHAVVAGRACEQRAQTRLERRRHRAGVGCQHLEGKRLHRIAGEHRLGLPNLTCTVGLPRRSTSLSMHGMSSWMSE